MKQDGRGGKREGAGRPKKEHSEWRYRYGVQKCGADRRGIEWQFDSFEQWFAWWGEDIHRRGKGKDDLVMARFGDVGPYHPNNVYKATFGENAAFKRSKETCEKMSISATEAHERRRIKVTDNL
jgi:hypothetical protein